MRVVELHGHLFGKALHVGVHLPEAAHDVVERARHKEVLLHEAQLLAVFRGVVRVEDLRDALGPALFADSVHVAATVEDVEVQLLAGLRLPQAHEIHGVRAVADNRNVVGQAHELLVVHPLVVGVAHVVEARVDAAEDADALLVFRADDLPGTAEFAPVVGVFDLLAVHEVLAEEAELVADAVADRRKLERRERIHEARRESSEAAVAQTHVLLDREEIVDVEIQALQRLLRRGVQARIDDVVLEHPPHEVFERKVVQAARVAVGLRGHCLDEAFENPVLNGAARRDPPVALRGAAGVAGERALQVVEDGGAHPLCAGLYAELEFRSRCGSLRPRGAVPFCSGFLRHGYVRNLRTQRILRKKSPEGEPRFRTILRRHEYRCGVIVTKGNYRARFQDGRKMCNRCRPAREILQNPPRKRREDFLTTDETGFTQSILEQRLLVSPSFCHPCSSWLQFRE